MSDAIAIAAVSRGVMATLADGTLRVKIDIEPADAEVAFRLLGMPGNPIAIARLNVGVATQPQEAEPEKPKGGALARLAGMWCQMGEFHDWLATTHGAIFEGAIEDAGGDVGKGAAAVVRALCGIGSRAELDSDEASAQLFHERLRIPFMEFMEEQK